MPRIPKMGMRWGGVAREEHPAVTVARGGESSGLVRRGPDHLERPGLADVIEVLADPADDVGDELVGVGGRVAVDLVVQAPDVPGLAVHEDGGAGIGGRVEPGPALGGVVAAQADVDDHVAGVPALPLQPDIEQLPDGAAGAVARHDPARPRSHRPGGRPDLHPDVVGGGTDRGDPGPPADPDEIGHGLVDLIEQDPGDVLLGEVEHGGEGLVGLVRHRQPEHLGITVEAAGPDPGHALLLAGVRHTEGVEDLESPP
nr:hypothetical protein [Pseudonocardia sp. ICBG601]